MFSRMIEKHLETIVVIAIFTALVIIPLPRFPLCVLLHYCNNHLHTPCGENTHRTYALYRPLHVSSLCI